MSTSMLHTSNVGAHNINLYESQRQGLISHDTPIRGYKTAHYRQLKLFISIQYSLGKLHAIHSIVYFTKKYVDLPNFLSHPTTLMPNVTTHHSRCTIKLNEIDSSSCLGCGFSITDSYSSEIQTSLCTICG